MKKALASFSLGFALLPLVASAQTNFTVVASTSPNLAMTGIQSPAQLQILQPGTWQVFAYAATSSDPLLYAVSWGDASTSAATSSPIFTHYYAQPATYKPQFTVSDASSTDSATGQVSVVVSDSETAPAQTSGSACTNITMTLQLGMSDGQTGGQVTALQNFLIAQGDLASGNATGYFGASTQAAVEQFQTAQGISAVGFVGPQTRTAISNVCQTQTSNSGSQVNLTIPGSVKLTKGQTVIATKQNVSIGRLFTLTSIDPDGTSDAQITIQNYGNVILVPNVSQLIGVFVFDLTSLSNTTATISVAEDDSSIPFSIPGTVTFTALGQGADYSIGPNDTGVLQISGVHTMQLISTYPTASAATIEWDPPCSAQETNQAQDAQNGVHCSSASSEKTTLTLQQPKQVVGGYTLLLTAVSASGATIKISGGTSQNSGDLTATPTSGAAPLQVQFSGTVPGTMYTLDFGDGTTPVSSAQTVDCVTSQPNCGKSTTITVNETHTYAQNGSYVASLTNGAGTQVGSSTISVGTSACAQLPSTVSPGSSGSLVLLLQQLLTTLGLLPASSNTGYYGTQTTQAVQSYQSQNGIVSSGSPGTTGWGAVGPRTRAGLNARCGGSPAQPQHAVFTATPSSGQAPLAVLFSSNLATSSSSVDFGDGTTGPLGGHTYSNPGTYIASLVSVAFASSSCGAFSYDTNNPFSFLHLQSAGCSLNAPIVASTTVTVSGAPSAPVSAAAPSCALSLVPSTITAGGSATLNYSTQNGTSLSITGVGSSGSSLGSVGVNPSVSTTYNATVTGPGGTGNCSAALTVQKANQTFQVGADCNGSFCAADQATADQYCVQQGFGSAANFQSYPVTQSNPNNGGVYTGNEAWWNGSGWGYAWGGQCNAGGGCTPENGYEIYQATCQASVPATPATPSQGQVNQLPSP